MYRDWIIKVLYPILDCFYRYNALDTCKPKDYQMTFGEWELLAKQGIAEAEYNLGLMFSRGREYLETIRRQSNGIGLQRNNGLLERGESDG